MAYTSTDSDETHKSETLPSPMLVGFKTPSPGSKYVSHIDDQLGIGLKLRPHCDTVVLMVVNFSEEQFTVPKGTVLGVAQELLECLVVPTGEEESPVNGS